MEERQIQKILKLFPWLRRANFKNVEAKVYGKKLVINRGEWLNGNFIDGTAMNMDWHEGTVKDGIFNFIKFSTSTIMNGKFDKCMFLHNNELHGGEYKKCYMYNDFIVNKCKFSIYL